MTYTLDGCEYNGTELAIMLANGKMINPYRGDMDTYYSALFYINELTTN